MIGGIDWKSPEGTAFQEEMDRLGVRGQCVMTGRLSECDVADHLSVLDYAVLLYESGLSPRNATFLAAMDQNVKIITTSKPDYRPDFPNVLIAKDGPGLAEELCRIMVDNRNKKLPVPVKNYYRDGWKEYTARHLEFYEKVIKGKHA